MASTPTPAPVIVWFRQDLRLSDHPALSAAAASGAPVIPVYVLETAAGPRPRGGASLWWLDKSLRALSADLAALGSRLILRRGDAAEVVAGLAAETGAGQVVWSRLYDAPSIARDTALKARLKADGVEAVSFNSALLKEPWRVKTGSGAPYRVFTPYWRAARQALEAEDLALTPAPGALPAPTQWPAGDRLEAWGLHPTRPDWSEGFTLWTPGEAGARARLDQFLERRLSRYADDRNAPGVEGSSRLSPHLHFGEISPRQVWAAAHAATAASGGSEDQRDKFLSEVGWREFNHHGLFHQPDMATRNVKPAFDAFPWRDAPQDLEAWRRGATGYPIVDAGMRELWRTGFMHNRVRMIAASLLIKHLLIDWREGEAWFWDTLVDADAANNAANWQWVAGSGADASPYFRIFNPVTQGEKFDPKGVYVRRWVPELARLPDAFLNRPWEAPAAVLASAGVTLGQTYPRPIVDHAQARTRALDAFAQLKAA